MANILVAALDSACLDPLCAELAAEGHDVDVTTDGHDAYTAALARTPDLVFLETNLPTFNGYETCAMLRADPSLPAALPVLLLTGADFDSRALEKAGATGHFPKRHSFQELREIVVGHLAAAVAASL